jgi:hypothetical protein
MPADSEWTEQRNDAMREGVKGLFLMNGGGAVALLAFLQEIWKEIPDLRIYVLVSILVLSFGVVFASLVQFLRFKASWELQNQDKTGWEKSRKYYLRFSYLSIGAFVLGIGFLVVGCLGSSSISLQQSDHPYCGGPPSA